MADNRDLDRVRLPEEAARRLIERATELDAVLSKESSVANLREAAREAGISEEAFQRALDEVRAESVAPRAAPQPAGVSARHQWIPLAIVAIVASVALAVFALRVRPHQAEAVPTANTPTAAPTSKFEPKASTKAPPAPTKTGPVPKKQTAPVPPADQGPPTKKPPAI